MRVLLASLVALMTAGCSTVEGGPSTAITKTEARSMPASVVKKRVLQQLSDVLSEVRFNHRRPSINPLTDMSFVTPPRATDVPGLCQLDMLKVTFRLSDDEQSNADTPAWVDGFSSTRYFHFARPPESNFNDIVDYDHEPSDSSCHGAELWEDEFFTAPDERAATDGFLLAHRVIDSISKGNPNFGFECNKYPTESARKCSDIARETSESQISSIDRCENNNSEFRLASCYSVYFGDRSLRIIASPYASGPNVLPSLTILSVKLDSLIVMAHERVD